jgi:4-carboxymuconolactone decarboxylase
MSETHEKNHMKLPETYRSITERYPEVARAFQALGDAIHGAGPLSERERRLVKLAISVGARLEGGVHSNARKCLYSGMSPDEVRQVVLLSLTTIGFPSMVATSTWVEDVIASASSGTRDEAAVPEEP